MLGKEVFLIHWDSSSQLEMILTPLKGLLTMSGGSLVVTAEERGRRCWHLWGEARDIAEEPTECRTAPTAENSVAPSVRVAEVGTPCPRTSLQCNLL